nr:uncharacterized protein LOC109177058 [Ipomoea batatas]
MMLAVVEFVHNFTSVSQILSSDYLQRIYGCSHVFAKWNSKSTSTVLLSVDSSERRSCGSQTCTDRPKLEREDSYFLLQLVILKSASTVQLQYRGIVGYEMAPGQSKKRSRFLSSSVEVTNRISLVTNTEMRLDVVNFREDSRVFQCVENILKVRYRNYKHALHKEFLKYTSATEAKLHVPKDRIALFKFTRCKNDKWITNEAEENYKKMVAMLETSELEGNPMTVVQVYDVVMGKKSGYIKGMGNGPKPVTSTSTRANNSHLEEKMKATMKENTQLKNEVQELKMKFERYEKSC